MDFTVPFFIRKLGHVTIYMILTLLILRALHHHHFRWKAAKYFLVFLLAFLYAMSDEYHQSLTGFRDGRWMDVGIDSIGILIGICIHSLLSTMKKWIKASM